MNKNLKDLIFAVFVGLLYSMFVNHKNYIELTKPDSFAALWVDIVFHVFAAIGFGICIVAVVSFLKE